MHIEKIKQEVLLLPEKQRAMVAREIIMSLEEYEDFNYDEEWEKELEKRADEIKTGKVSALKADDVFNEIKSHLK